MEGFAIPALASAVAFAATSSGLLHPPASVALPFNCLHFRDFTAVGGLAALWLCLRVFLQGDLTLHFLKVSRTFAPPRSREFLQTKASLSSWRIDPLW